MLKSLIDSVTGTSRQSGGVSTAEEEAVDLTSIPPLYVQCRTKREKIAWLHSDYGQNCLKHRPVLHEYYHNGYLFRIVDNPHWKTRLEDWLTLRPLEEFATKPNVPYGLSLPKTEEERWIERVNWLHSPLDNPPMKELFGEYFDLYRSSPEYYEIPLENRLQLLTDGFTILRNIVPLDLVENADASISNLVSNADPKVLEKMGVARELIYDHIASTRALNDDTQDGLKTATTKTTDEESIDKTSDTYKNSKASGNIFTRVLSANWSSNHKTKQQPQQATAAVAAPLPDRKVGELPKDPFFLSGVSNELPILALYYASRVHTIVEYLLHGTAGLRSGSFRPATGGGQVAYRFSQPMSSAEAQYRSSRKIGGSRWHIDGLQNGAYGSFSFLIGFPLSDQQELFSGNLCLHAGSHYELHDWLKDYALRSVAAAPSGGVTLGQEDSQSVNPAQAAALAGSQRHLLNPAQRAEEDARLQARRQLARRANQPVLDEPVQVQMSPGDVVLALHKVAHLGGPNLRSTDVRKMVYFRVSHKNHSVLRYESLEQNNIWIEYEGLHDLL